VQGIRAEYLLLWHAQAGGAHFLAEKVPDAPSGAPQEHPLPDAPTPSVEAEVAVAVRYTVHGDGSLRVDWQIDASRALPNIPPQPLFSCAPYHPFESCSVWVGDRSRDLLCHPISPGLQTLAVAFVWAKKIVCLSSFSCRSLPRIGMHLGVPSHFSRVHWYGRGPQESYPDRKYGAFLRQYSLDHVQEMHVPYIFPSAHKPFCETHFLQDALYLLFGNLCDLIHRQKHVFLQSHAHDFPACA
jgi:hypothetical protein